MKAELLQEHVELMKQLKNVTALQRFGTQDLQRILNSSEIKQYQPGEIIIAQESFDTRVYFLITGEVKVMRDGVEIDILRRTGDVFGEMSIIDGAPRSASIYAGTPVVCLMTDISFVDSLLTEDKASFCAVFYRVILEVLARRLRETNAELVQTKKELETMKKQCRQ